jgi:hypothetical protein
MSGSLGVFGSHSIWSVFSTSIPYSVYRNFERCEMPSRTTINYASATTSNTSGNTVLCMTYKGAPWLLFASGPNLDQVALISADSCDVVDAPLNSTANFVVQLDGRLISIMNGGSSFWSEENIFWIATESSLYLFKITSMLPSEKVVLEPLEKYSLPEPPVSISTCPLAGIPCGAFLTADGGLTKWDLEMGLGSRMSLSSLLERGSDVSKFHLQYSFHPQECFLSASKALYLVDFRQRDPKVLYHVEAGAIVSSWQSSCHSGLADDHVFISRDEGDEALLIDMRASSRPLGRRKLPGGGNIFVRTTVGEAFAPVQGVYDSSRYSGGLPGAYLFIPFVEMRLQCANYIVLALIIGGARTSRLVSVHSVSGTEISALGSMASRHSGKRAFLNSGTEFGAVSDVP